MKGVLSLRAGGDTFTPELVEAFLDEYTKPGDVVFDPFAGFGTTLVVAERMGRRPLGIEIMAERVEVVRAKLEDPSAILCADTRNLDRLDLPPIDFSITSPPYMSREDHPQNPLTGYQTLDGDYQTHLDELAAIYRRVATCLAPGGTVVINAANLRLHSTRLAWDIGQAVSTVLTYEREVVIDWDEPPTWLTNDYCLVFSS
ncbi:DNA methyltransferase [Actinopolymorpha sp. B11F2]|uniref:TRM11 family SAM-dependent methyltransferase n=1 Tax=Actinopolymorpha sp. B11F2 TaxID=3160862 RepID=UPI0032E3BBE5